MDPHSYPMQAIRRNEVIWRNQRFQAYRWLSSRPAAQSNPSPSPVDPLPLASLIRTSIPDPNHPAPPTHPSWLTLSPRRRDAPSASGGELPSLVWLEEWVDKLVEEWAPDEASLLQEAHRQQEAHRPLQGQEDKEMALVQSLSTSTDEQQQQHRPPPAPTHHCSPCACLDEHGREKEGEWLCLPSLQAPQQNAPILLLSSDQMPRRWSHQAALMWRADDDDNDDDGDGSSEDEDCDDDADVASTSTLPSTLSSTVPSTPFQFNVGAAAFKPRAPSTDG